MPIFHLQNQDHAKTFASWTSFLMVVLMTLQYMSRHLYFLQICAYQTSLPFSVEEQFWIQVRWLSIKEKLLESYFAK